MKNLIVCFDSTINRLGPRDATNAEALFRLLDTDSDGQLTWYDAGEAALRSPRLFNPMARQWRETVAAKAREAVVDAYFFLAENWEAEDRIFLLGAGRGAYCARALARMLGTIGILDERSDHVVEYALAAFALPSNGRTSSDWAQIKRLARALSDGRDVAVPVHFLGLWDTVKVPGTPAVCVNESLGNVVSGRHAVAIDGGLGPFGECRIVGNPDIEEVWFRGTHCDVVGGPNAYWPLADITLDWMIDGLVTAGAAVLIDGDVERAPAPTELDALAEGAPSLRFRKVPEDALVHASVDVYLRAHSDYWRRLPYRIMWADLDWAARAERMPCLDTAPAVRAEEDSNALTAVAS